MGARKSREGIVEQVPSRNYREGGVEAGGSGLDAKLHRPWPNRRGRRNCSSQLRGTDSTRQDEEERWHVSSLAG